MDDILATILKDTFSLAQYRHRLRILKSQLLKTFFGGNDAGLSIPPSDLNWLQSLPPQLYQQFNKDNVYKILSTLEEKITSLPALTAYLTFEPDEITLNQIGSYARGLFGPKLLLDIKFDPFLIAGTALVWKGIYRDYSLRTGIEQKKPTLLQEFKKFLR